MDEIGKFAVDIKERYEMFFDAFSKKYPSGINFFNKKFMVGEIRNLFIVDVLAPVSMIYVMSDAKERKEMAAAAKYIFGLEDIEKILICMIDEIITMGICFLPRSISETYDDYKLPGMLFDFIKGAVLAICFPHGKANIDQRMFLLGSYIEFNKKALKDNGRLETDLVPISGFPTYKSILKKYDFTIKPYIPLEDSRKAKGFHIRMATEIRQRRVQEQVKRGNPSISFMSIQTLNNMIFEVIFFDRIKDIAPRMLETSGKDKKLYAKILREDKTVVRSLFTEFSANILEKKAIIEFCVEYLGKSDCENLAHLIVSTVCEVHDYTENWESSCFKLIKMLLYDFKPYCENPPHCSNSSKTSKYDADVQKMIRMLKIIIPALDVEERREALLLLGDRLYKDKYSFFTLCRYKTLAEKRREEEEKMPIEEIRQCIENFYNSIVNMEIRGIDLPANLGKIAAQNMRNDLIWYMIYLSYIDETISEEDLNIFSTIFRKRFTPLLIRLNIIHHRINLSEFESQIPRSIEFFVNVENLSLLKGNSKDSPSKMRPSEILLIIYRALGAKIVSTNKYTKANKSRLYHSYINMLDRYITNNYKGERFKDV